MHGLSFSFFLLDVFMEPISLKISLWEMIIVKNNLSEKTGPALVIRVPEDDICDIMSTSEYGRCSAQVRWGPRDSWTKTPSIYVRARLWATMVTYIGTHTRPAVVSRLQI